MNPERSKSEAEYSPYSSRSLALRGMDSGGLSGTNAEEGGNMWSNAMGRRNPFVFWRKPAIFGRNGKHWFVRLPLWAQTTILIVTIGFLSLLILLVVSAVQVWSYSLNLMRQRLATSAGMVALSLEQQVGSRGSSISSLMSHASVVNFINSSNYGTVTPDEWKAMDEYLNLDVFLSRDVISAQFYDKSMNPIYSFSQRESVDTQLAPQNNLLPRRLYPLSFPEGIDDTLLYLENRYPAVIGNATLTANNGSDSYFLFSLSFGVTAVPVFDDLNRLAPTDGNGSESVGYATILFNVPLNTRAVTEAAFKNSYAAIVRERDVRFDDPAIVRNNSISSDSQGYFSFMYTTMLDQSMSHTTYSLDDMPVVRQAYQLMLENETPGDTNNTSASPGSDNTTLRNASWSGNSTWGNVTWTENNQTVTLNTSLVGLIPEYVTPEVNSSKTGGAHMRTFSPRSRHESIGYSYANIITDRWLVFVEINESDAYNDTRSLRDKLIGVAVGILGAVLLMVLPLSIWQTRGFYVVYQNMKLRPMFIIEEEDKSPSESSEQEKHEGPDTSGGPNGPVDGPNGDDGPNGVNGSNVDDGPNVDGPVNGVSGLRNRSSGISGTSGSSGSRRATWSEKDEKDALSSSSSDPNSASLPIEPASASPPIVASIPSHRLKEYRYAVPLPLPKLKRLYTDETDDLVETYNDMVARLNEQYGHLEERVRARTREAQQARELREEANAAKSEFIAVITHELRTPLNGIMGLTAVSADEQDPAKVREALLLIIDSGHVLMALLNELLELSKSLIGVDPMVTEFTPRQLAETLSNLFLSRMGSLSVSFALAAVPPQVGSLPMRGDLDHTVQICLSVMSNAMKFSPDGANVSVLTHLRPFKDSLISVKPYNGSLNNANAVLEVLVTDSGVGISPPQLAKMFDLFVQGDDPLRKNHKGAGLGMAFSKHLSEGIGGYITVYSAKDVGSTVVLSVPVEVLDLTAQQVATLAGPPIAFKVRHLFKTVSLCAGNVEPVILPKRSETEKSLADFARRLSADRTHERSTSHPSNPLLKRRSRHSHQSSQGSRILLNRSNQKKLLGKHHSEQSESSSYWLTDSSGGDGTESGSEEARPLSLLFDLPPFQDRSVSPDDSSDQRSDRVGVDRPVVELPLIELPNMALPIEAMGDAPLERIGEQSADESFGEAKPADKPAIERDHRPARLVIPPRINNQYTALRAESPPAAQPSSANSEKYPALVITPSSTATGQAREDGIVNKRVLVAEDNMVNLSILVKMLEQLGIKLIDTAKNGDEVVHLVEKSIINGFHYSLIFMDLSMPGKNGFEATNLIRGTLGYPYPIVALTGYADDETRTACRKANIQEVLTKPVLRHEIIRVLQKYSQGEPLLQE